MTRKSGPVGAYIPILIIQTINSTTKMFISKKALQDLKSQIAEIKSEIALDESCDSFYGPSFLSRFYKQFWGPQKTVKSVIQSIEARLEQQDAILSHQTKLQKMLFAHLGIEYAKTTEETATGKREKEVLRRAKKK